ncbi:MAG: outer membrane beta-barrel protein [Chitinophagales bacterium]
MKPTTLLLLTLTPILISAQSNLIGIKAGYSLTGILTASDVFEMQNNYVAGISYDFYIVKKISIDCEILYEERGADLEVIFTDANGNPTDRYIIPNQHNYISFPVKLSYHFGNKFFGFFGAGICPAILLRSEITYPDGYLSHFVDPMPAFSPTYSKYNFAGLAEIGCGYKLSDRFTGNLSVRYQKSSTAFGGYFDGYHFGTTVGLGLKYNLDFSCLKDYHGDVLINSSSGF